MFESDDCQAETAERAERLEEAVDLLREALALWRGPVLGGEVSRLLRGKAVRLDEERLGLFPITSATRTVAA
jgi:hypothetical protein